MKNTHTHRITPGHQGGEYTEENTIEVKVTECDTNSSNHAMWHYANWTLWRKKEDYCAWRGLAGMMGKGEIIKELQREGVKRGVETNRAQGTGTFDPKIQSLGGRVRMMQILENDPEHQSRAGKVGGGKCRDEKLGFFRMTQKQMSDRSKKAASQLYYDPDHPELGHRTATALHRMQTKRNYPNKPCNRLRVDPAAPTE